jgi:Xaa-Pro aminopeptidase
MQAGFFFGHHIGLSVDDPYLPDAMLEPGMVFTVEPWYYNHEDKIAVFVEDDVLVTATGAEVLTASLPRAPEDLERLVGVNR